MAGQDHRPDDDWGNWVAKRTFIATLILAVLYVASVFAFVMR